MRVIWFLAINSYTDKAKHHLLQSSVKMYCLCFFTQKHKPFVVNCVNIIRTLDHKVLHIIWLKFVIIPYFGIDASFEKHWLYFSTALLWFFNNHTGMTKVTNLQLWFISIRPLSLLFYKVYRILYYVKGCVCNKIVTVKLN